MLCKWVKGVGYFQHRRSAYAAVDTSNTPRCSRETKHAVRRHAAPTITRVFTLSCRTWQNVGSICKSPAVLVPVTAHSARRARLRFRMGPSSVHTGRSVFLMSGEAKGRLPSCCPTTCMFQFCFFQLFQLFAKHYHVSEVMNN